VLRTALLVAAIAVASPVRAEVPELAPEAAEVVELDPEVMRDAIIECATPEERSATAQKLNRNIDWFLSRLEVPADIAKQLHDTGDFQSFFTHPWGFAYLSRLGAQDLKSSLASFVTETHRETRLKAAISAFGESFELAYLLTEHARVNPDQRITDVGAWNGHAMMLQDRFKRLAICLVDVPSETPPIADTPK
jgi:hypothetical protein